MNTKKIILVSSDKDLISITKISSLTLTKLNCQVSVTDTSDYETALNESKIHNLDMVIIDLDEKEFNPLSLIEEIRNSNESKTKKIISVFGKENEINKNEIYNSGCDSIMSKDEFKKAVNNILQF